MKAIFTQNICKQLPYCKIQITVIVRLRIYMIGSNPYRSSVMIHIEARNPIIKGKARVEVSTYFTQHLKVGRV